MRLEDWLDDLCVRFIINLPPEELESVERICFQVEEAQWFYEDFIRPLDPSLPSLSLRAFSLRIFQHCPLFAQWDSQHYTTAFAEFLAYKSRVPVRGAIMLNENMDQVVLVKGWKKGANWSFPRGKINKDENDLDCAIREVYEETGFDIQAAGLVKEEKDMKYIEVTMREQHMRLYVFRGVPMDTHFEPKTRKEISKIEWYKLTDLPTLKKNKHQDGSSENLAVNANKFYMVAPFLVPLKKWIAQQRKRHDRHSSQAHLPPPVLKEETVTEDEQDVPKLQTPILNKVTSYGPSDLPEVSVMPLLSKDPSMQLKQLLNINSSRPQGFEVSPSAHPARDESKSNALLSLLRQGSTSQSDPLSHNPLSQLFSDQNMTQSPNQTQARQPPFSPLPAPPHFDHQTENANFFTTQTSSHQMLNSMLGNQIKTYPLQSSVTGSGVSPKIPSALQAPYQRTGDPEFTHDSKEKPHFSVVPPASALPKLTHHTRNLLDVLKGGQTGTPLGTGNIGSQKQQLPTITTAAGFVQSPFGPGQVPGKNSTAGIGHQTSQVLVDLPAKSTSLGESRGPQSVHQINLLNLFRQQPGSAPVSHTSVNAIRPDQAPVELAAQSTPEPAAHKDPSKEILKQFLQQKSEDLHSVKATKRHPGSNLSRESQTSATLSGPINQPQFDVIPKSSRGSSASNGFSRSPRTTNRTLYDPYQQPQQPVKILHRAEGSPRRAGRASQGSKASPKPPSKTGADTTKPFQPQILRRPPPGEQESKPSLDSNLALSESQISERDSPELSDIAPATVPFKKQQDAPVQQKLAMPPALQMGPPPLPSQSRLNQAPAILHPSFDRRASQDDVQRQNLLSLFSQPSTSRPSDTALNRLGIPETPRPTSHVVSPLDEKSTNSIDATRTRSRVGSHASMVSGTSQTPTSEKRQTTAGDRAFLLGYLGRIANQEG